MKRHHRRGFTLLETIMAAMLGVVVVLATFGLLSAIRRTGERTRQRNEGSIQMARVHQAMAKALSQLVVLPQSAAPVPAKKGATGTGSGTGTGSSSGSGSKDNGAATGSGSGSGSGSGGASGQSDGSLFGSSKSGQSGTGSGSGGSAHSASGSNTGDSGSASATDPANQTAATDPGKPKYPPRMVLQVDNSAGLAPVYAVDAFSVFAPPGGGSPMTAEAAGPLPIGGVPMQRLELVVSEPPVMGGADGMRVEGEISEWMSKTRGAFELKADPEKRRGMELYWTTYDLDPPEGYDIVAGGPADGAPPVGADGSDLMERPKLSSLLVAKGLSECRWRVVKTGDDKQMRPLEQASVTTLNEIPAYVEMSVKTIQGQSAVWMFEVRWIVEPPKDPSATAAADLLNPNSAAAAKNNAAGGSGGRGGRGVNGRGSGGTGGGKPGGGRSNGADRVDDGDQGGLSPADKAARDRYLQEMIRRQGGAPR